MESTTKARITRNDVARLVSHHFPLLGTCSITELSGGMFNTAYKVSGGGQSLVVKIGPARDADILMYETGIMQAEVEVYDRLSSLQLPIPRIHVVDFSRSLIPYEYFFMDFISGHTWKDLLPSLSPQENAALKHELGFYTAALHSLEGPYFGYLKADVRYHYPSWSSAFSAMVTDIMMDGTDRGFELPHTEISAILVAAGALLDEVDTPRYVSFDLWAGNIMVQDGHIAGLIDFERGFYGDPIADFTSAWSLYHDIEEEPDVRKGYEQFSGKALEFTERDRICMDLYRLYLALIMTVETYRFPREFAEKARTGNAAKILRLTHKLQERLGVEQS